MLTHQNRSPFLVMLNNGCRDSIYFETDTQVMIKMKAFYSLQGMIHTLAPKVAYNLFMSDASKWEYWNVKAFDSII